jgi:hypothetical protein
MTDETQTQDAEEQPLPVWASGIPGYLIQELCRELAVGEVKRAALARKYGVSGPAISQFAKRHKWRIDEIRRRMNDEFVTTWIADKTRRIEAMQADFEVSSDGPFAGHYEQIRTRTEILRKVAEELGQIPNKSNITIGGTVRHELVGVDVDQCFPAAEPGLTEEEP